MPYRETPYGEINRLPSDTSGYRMLQMKNNPVRNNEGGNQAGLYLAAVELNCPHEDGNHTPLITRVESVSLFEGALPEDEVLKNASNRDHILIQLAGTSDLQVGATQDNSRLVQLEPLSTVFIKQGMWQQSIKASPESRTLIITSAGDETDENYIKNRRNSPLCASRDFATLTLKHEQPTTDTNVLKLNITDIPFPILRAYFIHSASDQKARSRAHAHRGEKEIFIQLSGESTLIIDQGDNKGPQEHRLTKGQALYIPNFVWHQVINPSLDCMVGVLSSTQYTGNQDLRTIEYIEDPDQFQRSVDLRKRLPILPDDLSNR